MKRWLQRTTKEERNTIYAPAQDEEDEGGEDDFLTDKLIEIGDPYQLVALHDIMALDDREAVEKAIRPQGPSGQRYIVEAMRVMGQWELARDPTVKEMAERLATPRSHQYVEKLRARWRDRTDVDKARPAATPTPRPPTQAPSLPIGYREDLHARFLAAVARKDKQLLAAQARRRRNHQPHEWVPDDQRGSPYYSCECGVAGRKDLTTGQIRKVP